MAALERASAARSAATLCTTLHAPGQLRQNTPRAGIRRLARIFAISAPDGLTSCSTLAAHNRANLFCSTQQTRARAKLRFPRFVVGTPTILPPAPMGNDDRAKIFFPRTRGHPCLWGRGSTLLWGFANKRSVSVRFAKRSCESYRMGVRKQTQRVGTIRKSSCESYRHARFHLCFRESGARIPEVPRVCLPKKRSCRWGKLSSVKRRQAPAFSGRAKEKTARRGPRNT
jgi:hypothetical protein